MTATLTEKGEKMSKDDDKEYKAKIPIDILDNFLTDRIHLGDREKISKISDHFLWATKNIERHRINVWMRQPIEGQYCEKNYIGYSWFVHYYTDKSKIVDKTIIQEPKDGKEHRY